MVIVSAPVEQGIIEENLDALFVAFIGQLLYHIALEGGIHDVEVRLLGVPQAEAVVVAGDQRDVLHSGRFGQPDPLGSIKINGVEKLHQALVILMVDVAVVHHPFAAAQQ